MRSLRWVPGSGDAGRDRGGHCGPDVVAVVGHDGVGEAERGALLAAVDAPDQGPVGRVEFGDAAFLFDHGGAVEPETRLLGDDQSRAQRGGDAHATEASDLTGNDPDHRGQRPQIQ